MADSSSVTLDPDARARLLDLARASIAHGLAHGRPLEPGPDVLTGALAEPRASFVTLRRDGELAGCIGALEATRPLALDVAAHAFAAAFRDPRFPALGPGALNALTIEISVLSEPERLDVADEPALLDALVPGVDGLVLNDGDCGATFLPQVWDELATPEAFVAALKRKAGLPPDYWSPTLAFARYHVEHFADPVGGRA